jgi:hypothetical protein
VAASIIVIQETVLRIGASAAIEEAADALGTLLKSPVTDVTGLKGKYDSL